MWYSGNKEVEKSSLNEELLKIGGELPDKEAKISLAKFLHHNLGFTTELLSILVTVPSP